MFIKRQMCTGTNLTNFDSCFASDVPHFLCLPREISMLTTTVYREGWLQASE
jgi:hypothetical protein